MDKNIIEKALEKKADYLSKNPEYRKQEAAYHRHTAGKYIGDLIYGANDGIITAFAVVAGAAGAHLSPAIIIILGFANLLADGLSMGASNYLGGKSEQDYAKSQRKKESWEIEHLRELEVDEIREIYSDKGFSGKDLDRAVGIVTSNKEVWLDTMMREELGIIEDSTDDPKKHGIATFLAFLVAGLVPLVPYLLPNLTNSFVISSLVGALTLFIVGGLRSLVTTVSWFKGGVEMLIIGSGAAGVAFAVGAIIENLVR